jgi:hypothetical protein
MFPRWNRGAGPEAGPARARDVCEPSDVRGVPLGPPQLMAKSVPKPCLRHRAPVPYAAQAVPQKKFRESEQVEAPICTNSMADKILGLMRHPPRHQSFPSFAEENTAEGRDNLRDADYRRTPAYGHHGAALHHGRVRRPGRTSAKARSRSRST